MTTKNSYATAHLLSRAERLQSISEVLRVRFDAEKTIRRTIYEASIAASQQKRRLTVKASQQTSHILDLRVS